jgi:hypothetical protein
MAVVATTIEVPAGGEEPTLLITGDGNKYQLSRNGNHTVYIGAADVDEDIPDNAFKWEIGMLDLGVIEAGDDVYAYNTGTTPIYISVLQITVP